MLGDLPNWVFGSCPAVAHVAWLLSLGRSAVLAFLDVRAGEMLWVFGEVVLAALFGDAVGLGVGIDAGGESTVTASSGLAVDDYLRGKGDVRPTAIASYVDPVSNGAGTSLRPTTAAVCGNVLVFVP